MENTSELEGKVKVLEERLYEALEAAHALKNEACAIGSYLHLAGAPTEESGRVLTVGERVEWLYNRAKGAEQVEAIRARVGEGAKAKLVKVYLTAVGGRVRPGGLWALLRYVLTGEEPQPLQRVELHLPALQHPMHPNGPVCTCGGEGACTWCKNICTRCGGDGLEPIGVGAHNHLHQAPMQPPTPPEERCGNCGRPLPGSQVAVCAPGTGCSVDLPYGRGE